MTLTTYPLDNTDYAADDAALFHCTRTTGIYAKDDFSFSVSGADNILRLDVGLAWMRLNRFKGVVAALKNEVYVDLGLPDPVQPRIDRVILQYDANRNTTQVAVKKGIAAGNPYPPERSTTEALFEIHLIEVRRNPGAVSITAADVTDLRLNEDCCGLMADSVTEIDTKAINAQAMALINGLREEIQNVKDGTAFLMKAGDRMTGPLDMGGKHIKGLPNPLENGSPIPKGYGDTTYLKKAGGTMSGPLDMAGKRVTNLPNPGAPGDAVPLSALDNRTKDYILEHGTSGIWTWEKWASGMAECYCRKNYSGETNEQWGNLYVLLCNSPEYPFDFIDYPIVEREITLKTGSSCWMSSYSVEEMKQAGTFALTRPSKAVINADVSFYVTGKWK